MSERIEVLREFNIGHLAALIGKLGGAEQARLILQGKLKVSTERLTNFFSKKGRAITDTLSAEYANPDSNLCLVGDITSYNMGVADESMKMAYDRAQTYFKSGVPDFDGYVDKVHGLIAELEANSEVSNILKSPHAPIVLPLVAPLTGKLDDYGSGLVWFVNTLAESYKEFFPGRKFVIMNSTKFTGRVDVSEESRHSQLLLRMGESPVAGIYFPNSMQGLSPKAQREFIQLLPEGFLLSGGFDTAAALLMYPRQLASDQYTPGYSCSAINHASGYGFMFAPERDKLSIFTHISMSKADPASSGGLLYIGK